MFLMKNIIYYKTIISSFSQIRQKKMTKYSSFIRMNYFHDSKDNGNEELIDISKEEEKKYEEMTQRIFHIPEMGHQVLVLQPYIKWRPKKEPKITTPSLKLAEAVSLINTLYNWKVVDQMTIPLLNIDKVHLFGTGTLENICNTIKENSNITAVFISINTLKGFQHAALQKLFDIPVFDRYMIVMQIFKEHAITQEAKIQIKMAEIPYLWSRIKEDNISSVGGKGETFYHVRRQILNEREKKLKKALKILKQRRDLLRAQRTKHKFPMIAVVGYTNAGKTSLIKALTGSKKLEPKDQLFATLDVTVHGGLLPNRVKVLYVDTLGFISDIPTNLIEAFNVTLEDVMLADIIIHVRDISHPDTSNQEANVLETLQSLNINSNLINDMITIGNKVDLLDDTDKFNDENIILTSTVNNIGLNKLLDRLQQMVLNICNRKEMIIRVPTGGKEAQWLYKEAVVINQKPDTKNVEYSFLKVIISESTLNKFKTYFIGKKSRN